jgi:DNA-binding PadR family transcriptional regulator
MLNRHDDEFSTVTTALTWPSAVDVVPEIRCRFTVAPPRHFLYPALLLLLKEQPCHGYRLVDGLNELGLGRMDRPSVYRALADLERDLLVASWDEPPTAGSIRHVYGITAKGDQVLEAWMSVVAQERSSLDLVLQRYWYCNAQRFAGVTETFGAPPPGHITPAPGPAEVVGEVDERGSSGRAAATSRVRFDLLSDRSTLVVEARSNIGPIAFGMTGLTGWVVATFVDGLVVVDPSPAGFVELRVGDLTSGNILYDTELLRRLDVRRFPIVTLELKAANRMGEGNCYRVDGDVTTHGVTRRLQGVVTATVLDGQGTSLGDPGHRLIVGGEYVLDMREFELAVPTMLGFKLYPDVRLHLHIEAWGPRAAHQAPHRGMAAHR